MLKSLDILIGLSVIMLIVSMAVTVVNQIILNAMAARGVCLQKGLADLLQHLDWKMPRQDAEDIAAMALTQPSVRKQNIGPFLSSLFPSHQFAEVIHREELTKILLSLGGREAELKEAVDALDEAIANNHTPAAQQEVSKAVSVLCCAVKTIDGLKSGVIGRILKALAEIDQTTEPAAQRAAFHEVVGSLSEIRAPLQRMVAALHADDIANPGQTLENVRMMALQLEKSNPEQANDVRQNNALLQEASSRFLAKINLAFDPTMDRVANSYTLKAYKVTFFSAAVIAFVLQLDTVYIFNRLSMDDKMRDALVSQAAKVVADQEVSKAYGNRDARAAEAAPAPAIPASGAAADNPAGKLPPQQRDELRSNYYLSFLGKEGIIKLPRDWQSWRTQWETANVIGILFSMALLSLGAPFWYNVLAKLLRLRSILAQKDDEQRITRQTTQAPQTSQASSKPGTPQTPSALGERGNLGVAG